MEQRPTGDEIWGPGDWWQRRIDNEQTPQKKNNWPRALIQWIINLFKGGVGND